MAKHVVPSISLEHILIKCYKCKTMYEPEEEKSEEWGSGRVVYEKCPVCGYDSNDYSNVIPLWKYNLIKYLRGGFRERGDNK